MPFSNVFWNQKATVKIKTKQKRKKRAVNKRRKIAVYMCYSSLSELLLFGVNRNVVRTFWFWRVIKGSFSYKLFATGLHNITCSNDWINMLISSQRRRPRRIYATPDMTFYRYNIEHFSFVCVTIGVAVNGIGGVILHFCQVANLSQGIISSFWTAL